MSEPTAEADALAEGEYDIERPGVDMLTKGGAVVPIPAVKKNRRTGKLYVENPSPLRNMAAKERERWLLGFLEACAVAGDAGAAKDLLAHRRWVREMHEGRAPQRHELMASGTVTVVDDVSGIGGLEGLQDLASLGEVGRLAVKALLEAVSEGRDLRTVKLALSPKAVMPKPGPNADIELERDVAGMFARTPEPEPKKRGRPPGSPPAGAARRELDSAPEGKLMPVHLDEVTPPSTVDDLPEPIKGDLEQWNPNFGLRAVQMPTRFTVTLSDSHKMEGEPGDYMLEVTPRLAVVVPREEFEANYTTEVL